MELVAAVDEPVLDGVPHQMHAGAHHKEYDQQVLQGGREMSHLGGGGGGGGGGHWGLVHTCRPLGTGREHLSQSLRRTNAVSTLYAMWQQSPGETAQPDMEGRRQEGMHGRGREGLGRCTYAREGEGEHHRNVQAVEGSPKVQQPVLHSEQQPQVKVQPAGITGRLRAQGVTLCWTLSCHVSPVLLFMLHLP